MKAVPSRAVGDRPLPWTRFVGAALMTGLIIVLEATGHPAGLDPGVFVPLAVVVGVVAGGLTGGLLAALVGAPYLLIYFSTLSAAGVAGGSARVIGSLAASAFGAWAALLLRDRVDAARLSVELSVEHTEMLAMFTTRLANEPHDTMLDAFVRGSAELLDADMAVLTLLDPPSGRHFVRASQGGKGSALGVEVLPGVGITGQALRERRLIVTDGANDDGSVARLRRRLRGSTSAHQMAAMVGLQAGRVIASLTVGRSSGDPFGDADRQLLIQLGPLMTLAVAGNLVRSEAEEASSRDKLTGLYNHAYLEAALDQLVALRRRTAVEERLPLSIVMFDVDGFSQINEHNGRQMGDQVLRAVATILRQRFRASDIVARFGPDSFVVVLNGADPEKSAEATAQIRRQVRDLNLPNSRGEPVGVSVSAGCSVYHDGDRPDALLRQVTAALDTARWSGPGGMVSI